jgi:hypothetical protein
MGVRDLSSGGQVEVVGPSSACEFRCNICGATAFLKLEYPRYWNPDYEPRIPSTVELAKAGHTFPPGRRLAGHRQLYSKRESGAAAGGRPKGNLLSGYASWHTSSGPWTKSCFYATSTWLRKIGS